MRLERTRGVGGRGQVIAASRHHEPLHRPWLRKDENLAAARAEELAGDVGGALAYKKGHQARNVRRRHLQRTCLVGGLRLVGRLDALRNARSRVRPIRPALAAPYAAWPKLP